MPCNFFEWLVKKKKKKKPTCWFHDVPCGRQNSVNKQGSEIRTRKHGQENKILGNMVL